MMTVHAARSSDHLRVYPGGGLVQPTPARDKAPHILLVDDDKTLRSLHAKMLSAEGMRVSEAQDADTAYGLIARGAPDLILLDLILPGDDGLTLLRHISGEFGGGVIILSTRDDVIDRVAGLEAGADDYVCKPVHPRELLARIRAVLRRIHVPWRLGGHSNVIAFDGFKLDILQRQLLTEDREEVKVTGIEFELLALLATSAGRVLSRNVLLDLVRGRNWEASDRSIDQHISRLRRKIERDPSNPRLIQAVRGMGYVFAGKVTSVC